MTEKETPKTPDPYPKADLTKFDDAILLGNNIVVQRWTPEEMTEGGLILPSVAQAAQAVGWVVKTGTGVAAGEFTIGDTVIFPQHAIQALPEVGGRDDAATHFTEYNYLRAEDVVLRYPLNAPNEAQLSALTEEQAILYATNDEYRAMADVNMSSHVIAKLKAMGRKLGYGTKSGKEASE